MKTAGWKLSDLLFAAVALLLFLLPAALNRSPILYPDTVGYFQAGRAATNAVHLRLPMPAPSPAAIPAPATPPAEGAKLGIDTADGVSDARSVYYGAAFVVAWSLFGLWAIPLLQAVVCVLAIYAALRHLAPAATQLQRWAIVAGVGLLGGAGVFATTLMPDIFAGLLILAIAILAVYGARLSRVEQAGWLLLGTAAILFHKSHLLLALVMLLAMLGLGVAMRRLRWRSVLLVAGMIALGILGQVAVGIAIRHAGLNAYSPPFLLARMIGDRTAEKYLREACPRSGYESCRFLPSMPMTENEFLWSGSTKANNFASLPAADKIRVSGEQMPIVLGTLRSHGAEQLGKSVAAAFRQIGTVGITEFALMPRDNPHQALHADLAAYHDGSGIGHGTMPLRLISGLMLACYVAGGITLLALAWRGRHAPAQAADAGARAALLQATLLTVFGVLLNGAICGAISGVFDRYQGRVAWLIPLFALAILMEHRSQARHLEAQPA